MQKILGIDPGQHNGLAIFEGGKLIELLTVKPINLVGEITEIAPDIIIYEDSRLQSVTFPRGVNKAQMLKIARNIGMVDGICSLIVEIAASLRIPAHGISPKSKGAKLNAEAFQKITGWADKSNQHCRDAAMVAWGYKNASL